MKSQALFFAGCLLAAASSAQPLPPLAPSVPATDTYFGVKVDDPYRNLENLQDPAVLAWMKAQSEYARRTLDAIPGRQQLLAKMLEMDKRKAARILTVRITDNDRYFYLKIRPQDQQAKLYCRDGYRGAEVLLFDPENVEKGKAYTINGFSPNYDGSHVAFAISEKGAEIGALRILNVATRKLYPEQLQPTGFGYTGQWLPDNKSFTYTLLNSADVKDPAARLNTQAYLHRVGTPQSQDKIIFSAQAYPGLGITPQVYPSAVFDRNTKLTYGFLNSVDRYYHGFYAPVTDLTRTRIQWQPLFQPEQEVTSFATDKQYIYFTTSKNAPRQKIMRMLAAAPDVAKAEMLVPESADEALDDTQLEVTSQGLYFVRTRHGVQARLYFVARGSTAAQEIPLPQAAGRLLLESKNSTSPDLWVTVLGWTTDRQRYRYTAASGQFSPEPLSSEAQYPEFTDLVVEELMVPSHDGVLVPLSLIYKKGTPRNGTAPVFMYGYGAYASSITPVFMPNHLQYTLQGGIAAVPHVRGGGEMGEAWHKAGQKTTKPNTWKDLIACAEYLVKNRYTAPQKIAINGGSAGGVLIGRAMTERPDLFAAAIPEVGCLNAVRLENSPNGPVNIPEFGTMTKEDEAKALLEMDAYHHLKPGTSYPATLVTAGMNDPRVIAWQPAKFAARLQASNAGTKPVLFFTDYEAGHGHGNAKQKQFESIADVLAFALWQTGAPAFQPRTTEPKRSSQ